MFWVGGAHDQQEVVHLRTGGGFGEGGGVTLTVISEQREADVVSV